MTVDPRAKQSPPTPAHPILTSLDPAPWPSSMAQPQFQLQPPVSDSALAPASHPTPTHLYPTHFTYPQRILFICAFILGRVKALQLVLPLVAVLDTHRFEINISKEALIGTSASFVMRMCFYCSSTSIVMYIFW